MLRTTTWRTGCRMSTTMVAPIATSASRVACSSVISQLAAGGCTAASPHGITARPPRSRGDRVRPPCRRWLGFQLHRALWRRAGWGFASPHARECVPRRTVAWQRNGPATARTATASHVCPVASRYPSCTVTATATRIGATSEMGVMKWAFR